MWQITAPEPLACAGCEHPIAGGQLILSDAPVELPPRTPRNWFRHFHLGCEECESESCCYQTYASMQPTHVAEEEANCAYCGEAIWKGQHLTYDYSLIVRGNDGTPGEPSSALAVLLGRVTTKLTPFERLSRATQQRFIQAGGRSRLSFAQARALYNRMPWATRAQGERGILRALRGRHFSHIRSVRNRPDLAASPENIILENAAKNLRRGARDMSRLDRLSARASSTLSATGRVAAKSALLAALLEAPISAAENTIRVVKGRLSRRQAAENTATDATLTAVSAAVVGVTLLRIGVFANPVMQAIGVGIFAVSAVQRLVRAWQESPLTPLVLYFHPDCYSRYAAEVSAPPTDPGESEPSASAA